MSGLTNYVNDPEWGSYYELTNGGYYLAIIVMIIVIAIAALLISRKQDTGRFDTKKLACAGKHSLLPSVSAGSAHSRQSFRGFSRARR